MRISLLLLILLGALALMAAPAGAVTTVTNAGAQLTIAAAPGAANDITVGPGGAPGTVRVSDPAGHVAAAGACSAVDAATADCDLPGAVKADLGDGDDRFSAAGSPVPVDVDGGDGDDTFHVRNGAADTVRCGAGADDASDADHVDGLTACEETPDTAGAPDTSILFGPASETAETTAGFVLSATEPVARFECAWDGAPFAACGAAPTVDRLADGRHTLQVRAVDLVGHVDPVPATYAWIVDTHAPTVTLSQTPRAATNAPGADFTFHVDEPTTTVECRMDRGDWHACDTTTAAHYAPLGEAVHTFTVRATDGAGNTGSAGYTWTVDRTAPSVVFTATPAAVTNDTTPSFAVSVSEMATLECNLDDHGFVACSATASLLGLADGAHSLVVRSTDAAQNVAEIRFSWTQDSVRPQTQLTSGPATSAPVNTARATLTFASEAGARFECSLDGGAWQPCASPVTYGGLANGPHTFSVRAVDAAGNVDGTPITRSWTVKNDGAPTARIAVSRDADGFTLSAARSADPEGGALTYRWLRNGAAAGSSATVHYAAPDHETRDVFTVTVSDATGQRGQATIALRTRSTSERAPHEAMEVIRFAAGSRLAAGAKARIAELRDAIASGPAQVTIEGFARPSADAGRVSKTRAQTVRRLLLKGVAAPSAVKVIARGAAAPAASNLTAAGRARNDRVVVTVAYNGLAGRLVTEQEDDTSVRRSTAPQPVPAASGPAPRLFAFYSAVPGALRRLQEVGARVDVLAPNWYSLSPGNAAIRGGAPNPKVMALSRQLHFGVWPVVNATMHGSALIDSAAGRAKVVEQIAKLAARHRLAGVTLDMEEMLPRQKASFSALVAQLGVELHRTHRKLAVYAVRRTATEVGDSAAAYDWPALAGSADLVLASGYNEHSATSTPGPVSTQAGFDELARYAAATSRAKIVPTIGAIGYQWSGGEGRMLSSADAERRWPVGAEVGSADGRSQVTGSVRTFFESAEDLWAREQAARRAGAQWIGLFSLGREPERFWERSAVR